MFDPRNLLQRPGSLLRQANQVGSAVFSIAFDGLELTQSQFGALFVLHFRGPSDQSSVASELGLDKSTIGLVVTNLEARGLVKRSRSDVDKRRFVLSITKAGTRLFMQAEKRSPAYRERLLQVLAPAEAEQLLALLSKFVERHLALGDVSLEE